MRLCRSFLLALFADASKPQFMVDMAYLVGSRHEGYGFTAEEVRSGQKVWLEERKMQRTDDVSLADTMASREQWNRTMRWDESLEAKVSSLTAKQVTEAFRRHIDLSALIVVEAGDFKNAAVQ